MLALRPTQLSSDVEPRVQSLLDLERRSTGSASSRRNQVFASLSDMIRADSWLWDYSGIDPSRLHPVNFAYSTTSKLKVSESIAYARRAIGIGVTPRENTPLRDTTLRGAHFTTTLARIVPDFATAGPGFKKEAEYVRQYGRFHTIYSIKPLWVAGDAQLFCGFTAARKIGRPDFDQHELDLVHAFVARSQSVAEVPNLGDRYERIADMPFVLRAAVNLFLGLGDVAETASLLEVEPVTARSYLKKAARTVVNTLSIADLYNALTVRDDFKDRGPPQARAESKGGRPN